MRSRRPPRRPIEVYLLPAVVGAGAGDLEEVRAAAWVLRSAGLPVRWFGPPGTPRPVPPAGLRDWPVRSIEPGLRSRGNRALTVSAQFGPTSEGPRPFRLGGAGPWWPAVRAIERRFGPGQVLHVSLEEFARNLSADRQERERWREGGRAGGEVRARRRRGDWPTAVRRMRRLFRRHHALDRPNLIALFPTFRASRAFRRDFPTAVECGPIPSPSPARRRGRRPGRDRPSPRRWLWYASPASSAAIWPRLLEAAGGTGRATEVAVRTPRPLPELPGPPGVTVRWLPPMGRANWDRTVAGADLRIVTGGRSLLEAVEAGRPFLYFNGVTGTGRRRRAHRPEKLRSLLGTRAALGLPAVVRRDLVDFARGRRIGEILRRADADPRWRRAFGRFPDSLAPSDGLRPGSDRLRAIALGWRDWPGTSRGFRRSVLRAEAGPRRF